MNLQLSGLPALIVQVGFIVVFLAPVGLAAKIVGAEHPTLIRAARPAEENPVSLLIYGDFRSWGRPI